MLIKAGDKIKFRDISTFIQESEGEVIAVVKLLDCKIEKYTGLIAYYVSESGTTLPFMVLETEVIGVTENDK